MFAYDIKNEIVWVEKNEVNMNPIYKCAYKAEKKIFLHEQQDVATNC